MGVLQFIILSGPKLEYECIESDPGNYKRQKGQSWWLEKWKEWAAKIKEIAENEQNESELNSGADKAYKIMISLRPEMFW